MTAPQWPFAMGEIESASLVAIPLDTLDKLIQEGLTFGTGLAAEGPLCLAGRLRYFAIRDRASSHALAIMGLQFDPATFLWDLSEVIGIGKAPAPLEIEVFARFVGIAYNERMKGEAHEPLRGFRDL